MATITIRNLDEKVKRKLQVRAALNGRSMEAEAREIISRSVLQDPSLNAKGQQASMQRDKKRVWEQRFADCLPR